MKNQIEYDPEKFDADEYGNLIPKETKKYRVIEQFTVDLISEVEAEDEKGAKREHRNRIGDLPSKEYAQECDYGAGDSTYEIEKL